MIKDTDEPLMLPQDNYYHNTFLAHKVDLVTPKCFASFGENFDGNSQGIEAAVHVAENTVCQDAPMFHSAAPHVLVH